MGAMSGPPPSAPPPGDPRPLTREIRIGLRAPKGLMRKFTTSSGTREIRLRGSEITLEHPGALREPLTLPGGVVDLAVVDRGSSEDEHGRFAILHRMASGTVIPRDHGIEGWLWTTRQGSAFPMLADGDEAPNLALLFVKPLDDDVVERVFRPDWLEALADRSPLGKPSVLGLLAAVAAPSEAETGFREFGVLGDVTDREVPPTHRRHLATDKPANPTLIPGDAGRAETSAPPPGH